MARLTEKRRELLSDLAFENPAPQERWFLRCCWDPMHSLTEIRAAARAGHIELDDNGSPETIRFRFTGKGRSAIMAEDNR